MRVSSCLSTIGQIAIFGTRIVSLPLRLFIKVISLPFQSKSCGPAKIKSNIWHVDQSVVDQFVMDKVKINPYWTYFYLVNKQ